MERPDPAAVPSGLGELRRVVLTSVDRHQAHLWGFSFADRSVLTTQSPWRILRGEGMRVASEDDGHPFGLPAPVDAQAEARALLSGRAVASVEARPGCGDLRIEFGDGLALEILGTSVGHEAWQLWRPGRMSIVAHAGGFTEFPEPT